MRPFKNNANLPIPLALLLARKVPCKRFFICHLPFLQFSSVAQSCVQLFLTPWTAARQASLFITNSWSFLKLMSIKSVMPSNHLILCCPLLLPPIFPSNRVFSMSQLFASGGQSIGISASAPVLPMRIFRTDFL